MNKLSSVMNSSAVRFDRQARFSYAGFYSYAYFYFYGMGNKEPGRMLAVC